MDSAPDHLPLSALYRRQRGALARALRRTYPNVCDTWLEDAVNLSFENALRRPAAFQRAYAAGGERALLSFFHLVTRRRLRQELRRKAHNVEVGQDEAWEPTSNTTPECVFIADRLLVTIEAQIDRSADRFGGGQRDRVVAALRARLREGISDDLAASRYSTRREYVNRARLDLERSILVA